MSQKNIIIIKNFNKTYLHIILDKACSFDSSLYVETDVHFDLGFLIGQFNNWYLY